eukprot:scaffold324362_cov57-Tisochrysis_lutea.AAC.2
MWSPELLPRECREKKAQSRLIRGQAGLAAMEASKECDEFCVVFNADAFVQTMKHARLRGMERDLRCVARMRLEHE